MDANSLGTPNSLSWLAVLRDVLLVLAGGVCAAISSVVAVWYQSKKAGKIKFEQKAGEMKVEVYKKALRLTGNLAPSLKMNTYQEVHSSTEEEQNWILDNEMLLPPKFADNWHTIRIRLRHAMRLQESIGRMSDGCERSRKIQELEQNDDFMVNLAEEAEKEIRDELKLPPFQIRRQEDFETHAEE